MSEHWVHRSGYRKGSWYVECGCGREFRSDMLQPAHDAYEAHVK